MRELRDKGVKFEEYDFPGLKTVNGIATTGDLKTGWFKDSEGNTVAISNESRGGHAQGRLTTRAAATRRRERFRAPAASSPRTGAASAGIP